MCFRRDEEPHELIRLVRLADDFSEWWMSHRIG
jgi:hypothetical protein